MATVDGVPASLLPNQLTPAAWLAPQVAVDYDLARYVYVGTLAAFLWDWAMVSLSEYEIFFNEKVDTTKVVYAISRFATLIYLILNFLFHIAQIPNCHSFEQATDCFFLFAAPATSFLFYQRVCAVYDRSRIIMVGFGSLWLATLICTLIVPVSPTSVRIGTTNYCLQSSVGPYAASGIVTNIIYVWLVFLAICWRIVSLATIREGGGKNKVTSLTSGDGLSRLLDMLQQAGQHWYFFSAFIGLLTIGLLFSGTITPSGRAIASVPSLAVANATSTLVFRTIRKGIFVIDPLAQPARGLPAHSHVFREQDAALREAETFRGTMWSVNETATYAPAPSSYDGNTFVNDPRASMSKPAKKAMSGGKKEGALDNQPARSSMALSFTESPTTPEDATPPAYNNV